LLDELQYRLYCQFYAATGTRRIIVWDIARRVGKTYALLVLALECALQGSGRSIKYAAKTQVDVRKMIRPSIKRILATCPEDIRPKLDSQSNELQIYRTPKAKRAHEADSIIDIAGCDGGHYENLRGQEAHLWVVDEGAFVPELSTVVDEVLWPQTWNTGGPGVIASSPPDSPGHAFQNYYLGAKAKGRSAHATFWETPRYSEAEKWEIVRQGADMKRMSVEEFMLSTVYLREFMAEFVIEETRAVLPRFTEALANRLTVAEISTPLFSDWYTLIDLGGSRDPTGVLVGYYDFPRRKFRAQREAKLLRPTEEDIVKAARALEAATFSQMPTLRGLHFRIMDDDLGIVRRDLAQKYNFVTTPPRKDDKQAGLMDLQDALLRDEVEFSPEVPETVAQCRAAIWNKQHTEYERVEGFGHFDLLDCLLYGHRNVVPNKGRVPHLYGMDLQNTLPPLKDRAGAPVSESGVALLRAFGGR
jgi:hypothetical protein